MERSLARMFKDLLEGLEHIHCRKVVHRDIKPENFLVREGVVKICDFGFAATLPSQVQGLRGSIGTAPFMAPEVLSGRDYFREVDVWSLGVSAYVLLYGEFPYVPETRTSQAMRNEIRTGRTPPAFAQTAHLEGVRQGGPRVSGAAESFLRWLLDRNPRSRATAAAAQTCTWIRDANNASTANFAPVYWAALRSGAFKPWRERENHGPLDALIVRLHGQYERCTLGGAPLLDSPPLAQKTPSLASTASPDTASVPSSSGTRVKLEPGRDSDRECHQHALGQSRCPQVSVTFAERRRSRPVCK